MAREVYRDALLRVCFEIYFSWYLINVLQFLGVYRKVGLVVVGLYIGWLGVGLMRKIPASYHYRAQVTAGTVLVGGGGGRLISVATALAAFVGETRFCYSRVPKHL